MSGSIDDYVNHLNELRKIQSLNSLSNGRLAGMPAADIAYLRNNMFTDQASQDRIAPYEHRAYAREAATANPLRTPVLMYANPAYQASKVATNGYGSRTGASLEQLIQGWVGTGEGMMAGLKNYLLPH